MRFLLLVPALAGLAACSDFGPNLCTLGIVPGVIVEVRDSLTGAPLAEAARGLVRDGAFVDSLRPYGFQGDGTLVSLSAAEERSGTYEVVVERVGYLEWRASSVRVRDGDCHVETAELVAELQRTP